MTETTGDFMTMKELDIDINTHCYPDREEQVLAAHQRWIFRRLRCCNNLPNTISFHDEDLEQLVASATTGLNIRAPPSPLRMLNAARFQEMEIFLDISSFL